MKTLGGRQFWGDVQTFRDWRIQRNILTGHFRLLDARDYRMAWGTRAECQQRLQQIRDQKDLQPWCGHVVIALHGIIRSSKVWHRMKRTVEAEGDHLIALDYPSTRTSLFDAAAGVRDVIHHMEGADRISIVAHSMGGLVTRALFSEPADPRLHRIVMMGTPNNGAALADRFRDWLAFKAIFGRGGQQLVTGENGPIADLPIPALPTGLIAGCRGDDRGYNPLIKGDDDGIVSLASVRLPGAQDLVTIRCWHSMMPGNAEAVRLATDFLRNGAFPGSANRPSGADA